MNDSLLLRDATVQEIQLELIRRTKFNAFDGERIYASLMKHRSYWQAVLLDRPGLANYQMKNLSDALRFNQQCAAIKSPFQAKAAENARVMRQQGAGAKK